LRPGRQRIDIKEQSTSPNAEGAGSVRHESGGSSAPADMARRDPFELFTDEVKNSYLRCSYKWCFHHIPTLLDKVRKGTLEASLIWAILALAIRYVGEDNYLSYARGRERDRGRERERERERAN
jgi:hypothetical protein